MSFKCSVFGHRYGDPDVEREREEQGSEVVITIKEIETCQRCGEERVVSENKEVTTLETPSDIVGDDIEEETAAEPATESEAAETEPAAGGVAAEADAAADETTVETTDDAEFIDEGDEEEAEDDRDPGEWPDDEGDETAEPTGATVDQPEFAGESPESDGPDAEDDDGVIIDESDEEDASVSGREPGQWPDDAEEDDEDDGWAPSTEQELRPVEDEQPDVEPTSNAVTVPEGEFYCPECEFTTDVESSSLREGDFCPECHRGSLTHRTDAE